MLTEGTTFLHSLRRPSQRLRSGFWRQVVSVSPLCLVHCFISVTGACPPSRAWVLVAGLQGFASHWSGLNLGAGCQ